MPLKINKIKIHGVTYIPIQTVTPDHCDDCVFKLYNNYKLCKKLEFCTEISTPFKIKYFYWIKCNNQEATPTQPPSIQFK